MVIRNKKDKEAKDKDEKDQKLLQEYNEILADVEKIRQENKDPHLWNVKELKTVVKLFKRDGDAPLPPRKDGLYTRYLETRE